MCSVVGCDSSRRGAKRFKLPEDPERRLDWVQFLFEVNGQQLRESSCTDITICSEHFTKDCYVNVAPRTSKAQLKLGAVPTLCFTSEELDEPETCQVLSVAKTIKQETVETSNVASPCDQRNTCDSPSALTEGSGLTSVDARVSPVPSDISDTLKCDYVEMVKTIANIDLIREKAALLKKKGKYVVHEMRLLQLFGRMCPLCGSKVKVERVTYGVLTILNQQCLQCEYRNQWKSQGNASVPTAEDQQLTRGTDVTSLIQQTESTGVSVAASDDETAPMNETEESGNEVDEGKTDSDEDWIPSQYEGDEEEDDDYYPPLDHKHGHLCTDCGTFFSKRWPHTCEHKIKPFSCNICGKRCVNETALNLHSRVHDEGYAYRCKYCHATFKTKVDKITHQQTHLVQEKPYKCPDCSETFATTKKRTAHVEEHRGPKQLNCLICGTEFVKPRDLKRHLAVHTDLRPHKCSVCQHGFNQPSHLKSHMRMHTGERPYKCQHCGECFNHNVSLKSHVQRYHSSSPGREEQNVQKKRTDVSKSHRRSTGRPIGRPKRDAEGKLVLVLEGEMQGQHSNTTTSKVKVLKLKRTRCSHEEMDDKPEDISFDLLDEEEERSETGTLGISGSRGRAKNADSDSDFDPEYSEKKNHRNRSDKKSSGKQKGRPKKKQVVEDR